MRSIVLRLKISLEELKLIEYGVQDVSPSTEMSQPNQSILLRLEQCTKHDHAPTHRSKLLKLRKGRNTL
jgi:hypothetical protein